MALSSVPELIADIRAGKMVILMDDEDRENEGDLVMAAECITPEAINFMAKYGRGLICLPMTRERCLTLGLGPMVQANGTRHGTAFTASIEAAVGVSTGISAADRARTVQAAVAKNAKAADIVQPGHIFPLMAQPGGVLTRNGHTEASVDLARLAGFEPAGVIVEILNEDGSMARRPDLETFAAEHGLKLGTIADLIEYRSLHEKTVQQLQNCRWPTAYGDFTLYTYQDTIDGQLHHALVYGKVDTGQPVLTRVHVADPLADVLRGQRASGAWPIDQTLQRVVKEGAGVVLVLAAQAGNDQQLLQLSRYAAEDRGETPARTERTGGSRRIGIGSQILSDLGVHQLRLMSKPVKYSLSGFKLEVVEFVEP
ncbi:3,4-dihydroxy-2-butanone-4-phosphate synthase [Permianibacter sp. IMCC34836]|uniref:bifunctional 3,4-dihydroxy-2-butanone-4-phosphate synthase/GTP cyclohydrolase II n=1 Tax=Permianibacter fluminis TaxID=2738515 RepID=UPI001552554F|nr:bifunctional 3,4-dihydroxy-2-butanone-4-phosphate synthase/GTP cyclohydrolase II [Permianibacter fluminis]NQD36875.1 3,4-dihydroxy-2-butanone-4-phosphate synthase [Permianibacter fluminis]